MLLEQVNVWIDTNFKQTLVHRTDFYKVLLNYIIQRDLQRIVETGTSRDASIHGVAGDGCSTLIFAKFLSHLGKGSIISVDISSDAIARASEIVKEYPTVFYEQDSLLFFEQTYTESIDLLYLDSFDAKMTREDSIEAANHQLKEIQAAHKHLHKNSVVAIDDSYLKGYKSIPWLVNNGWKVTFHTPVRGYVIDKHQFYNFGNTILVKQ